MMLEQLYTKPFVFIFEKKSFVLTGPFQPAAVHKSKLQQSLYTFK